jgi:hypothetical protein
VHRPCDQQGDAGRDELQGQLGDAIGIERRQVARRERDGVGCVEHVAPRRLEAREIGREGRQVVGRRGGEKPGQRIAHVPHRGVTGGMSAQIGARQRGERIVAEEYRELRIILAQHLEEAQKVHVAVDVEALRGGEVLRRVDAGHQLGVGLPGERIPEARLELPQRRARGRRFRTHGTP